MLPRVIPHLESLKPDELMEASARLTRLGLRLFAKGLDPNNGASAAKLDDPLGLAQASLALARAAWANPGRVAEAQLDLWWDYATLAQRAALRLMGAPAEPVVEPGDDDRRTGHPTEPGPGRRDGP